MIENPQIHIYCGNGKGKTSVSLGILIRALGHGLRVMYVSFCKGHKSFVSGEKIFLKNCKEIYGEQFTFKRFGSRTKWESPTNITIDDKCWASINWSFINDNIDDYDIIILDEIASAIICGLVHPNQLMRLLDNNNKEFIMTGRVFPPEIMDKATLITEMNEIRHYYNNGVKTRKGIEF